MNWMLTKRIDAICRGGYHRLAAWFLCSALTSSPLAIAGSHVVVHSAGQGSSIGAAPDVAWAAPQSIERSDGISATAESSGKSDVTERLRASSFGFSIHPAATIDGILVEIEHSASGSTDSKHFLDSEVRLVKGGTVSLVTNAADPTTYWPVAAPHRPYGGSSDLWSETWTPADIMNTNFGVVVSAARGGKGGGNLSALVDHIRISVYYSLPVLTVSAGENGSASPAGAVPVRLNGSTNIVIASAPHFHIESIRTNGVLVGYAYGNAFTNTALQVSNVTSDIAIDVVFAETLVTNAIPETWLAEYFPEGSDYDALSLDDPDGDGLATWEEYVAGSDPTNAASSLQVMDLQLAGTSNGIQWISYTNWTTAPYRLERSTNLTAGVWEPVAVDIVRTPPVNTCWIPAPPANMPGYYRVVATRPL